MSGPLPTRWSDALPADYPQFLAEIKARVGAARTRAVLAVNSELIRLYWEIGHEILERDQPRHPQPARADLLLVLHMLTTSN
jgi:hypothetical protein